MNNREKKGFTLAELLVVVSIIGVLVAVAIPTFTNQLEKSKEATDFANVRSAYAELMVAVIAEDEESPFYKSDGTYAVEVRLKQAKDGWTTDIAKMVIGPVHSTDEVHWKRTPKAYGKCKISFSGEQVFIDWGGKEDHINKTSAADFLTKEILMNILGERYPHKIINSNEPLDHKDGGTRMFLEYAKQNGFDLAGDYDAKTWQILVRDSNKNDFLNEPAIYWSSIELKEDMVTNKVYVPVIGYRDGKYDVYRASVVKNDGNYLALSSGFANVTNEGGKATFQFDNYEDAKAAYDKLMSAFEKNGTIDNKDLSNNNL